MTREAVLSPRNASIVEAADLLKLIGNPNRLAILCRLCEGETSVSEMEEELGIRQPSLSQQLGELRKADLVGFRREAKLVFYRLTDERIRTIVGQLHALFCAREPAHRQSEPPPPRPRAARPFQSAQTHAAVFGRILPAEDTDRPTA
jgi:ArsR family transcriptional regulator